MLKYCGVKWKWSGRAAPTGIDKNLNWPNDATVATSCRSHSSRPLPSLSVYAFRLVECFRFPRQFTLSICLALWFLDWLNLRAIFRAPPLLVPVWLPSEHCSELGQSLS